MTAEVTDATGANRYEARVGDSLAGFADYLRTPELIAFVHTEVEPAYEGQGIGGALVRRSLDDAREAGLRVLAVCPFYSGWIARHPEYADLLYQNRSKVAD
ncbi:GNAT family N-acetyltransferase [Streptomyces sp. VRA16 Mangrove soil]|uniref:GNAT family N-acetyltransferase n=1 Tax=Streptomyces sp. VRA16 Mangrove soil TaxID=2817434 RepID=UPI001A9DE791|nr:GNAT family N-acetyltransferase [Streptomyces sp. VRA16 Mangrove soil]MBO1332831.1 N-acetyltransferase [Streptomyces sp. VRA16 Mangrove soil]